MKHLLPALALLFSHPTLATVTPDYARGEAIVTHEVPGRAHEVCVIPARVPGAKYSKKDLANEQLLCSYKVGENVAACPKDNSTNPGVNFFTPPADMSVAQLQTKGCEVKGAEKEAKYKLSTSCSYSPALLAYYHFSRALGDIGNVPVAVLRTMDLQRHIKLGEQAVASTPAGELINKTWRGLLANLKAGRDAKNPHLLFTDNYDQSYGALQKNPGGEEFYKEFFPGGADRVAAFRDKSPIYRALSDPALRVGREFNQQNVQAMLQLRDASEMILLDTILGQQDRFGNIHSELRYFYLDGTEVKSDKKKDVPAEFAAGAVAAKIMLLKDNDCGVAKENRIKAGKLLDRVSHMAPGTYKKLLALEGVLAAEENRKIFRQNMLLSETDFRAISANLGEAVATLKGACKAGRLKLDLSLDKHFSREPLPARYECEL